MSIFYNSLGKFPSSNAGCLLVHGLNNKPDVMKGIAGFLETQSFPVVIVSLTGHYHDFDKLKRIRKKKWGQDLLEGYTLIKNTRSDVYLVAYSIGAAISLDILTNEIKFNKMVLLAPAIAPRSYIKTLRYLTPLFPSLPLLSIAPQEYRANTYLPLKAYEVLIQLFQSLDKKKFQQANIPALVVVDPKDETMDFKKLKEIKFTYKLNHWKILSLNSEEVVSNVKFHHLIIDEKTMGAKNWDLFIGKLKQFLKN